MGGFHQTLPRDSALGGLDLWQWSSNLIA
jgi:hypothetical protein